MLEYTSGSDVELELELMTAVATKHDCVVSHVKENARYIQKPGHRGGISIEMTRFARDENRHFSLFSPTFGGKEGRVAGLGGAGAGEGAVAPASVALFGRNPRDER